MNWNALGNVTLGQLPSGAVPRAFVSAGRRPFRRRQFFTNIGGGVAAGRVAYWDGANWNDIGATPTARCGLLTFDGTGVWIGGAFTNIGPGFSPGVAVFQSRVLAGDYGADGRGGHGGTQSINAH